MTDQLSFLDDNVQRVRRCSVCHELKPETAYNRNRKGRNGLNSRCKECSRTYQAPYKPVTLKKCRLCHLTKAASEFSPHPRPADRLSAVCKKCYNETNNKSKLKKRDALKSKFVKIAGESCQRCGYSGFQAALEFHHVNRKEKSKSPASLFMGSALPEEEIYAELDKCVLLCSNCHRAFESSEWTAKFVRRGEKLLGYTVEKEDLQS